jgi:hypothetical protein
MNVKVNSNSCKYCDHFDVLHFIVLSVLANFTVKSLNMLVEIM